MLFRSEGAEKLELSMPWVGHTVYAHPSRVGVKLGEGDGKNEGNTAGALYPLFPR